MKRISVTILFVVFCVAWFMSAHAQMTIDDSGNVSIDNQLEFADGTKQATASAPPWNQYILSATSRFEELEVPCVPCFYCNPIVTCPLTPFVWGIYDKETGLVWERQPSTNPVPFTTARMNCYEKKIHSRMGWRLPTISELTSLIDGRYSDPALPDGHPFILASQIVFWSSNTKPNSSSIPEGLALNIDSGSVAAYTVGTVINYWCVRGGAVIDAN